MMRQWEDTTLLCGALLAEAGKHHIAKWCVVGGTVAPYLSVGGLTAADHDHAATSSGPMVCLMMHRCRQWEDTTLLSGALLSTTFYHGPKSQPKQWECHSHTIRNLRGKERQTDAD
jgi:hypothetical protein